MARGNVGIRRHAAPLRLGPLGIESFEAVAETNALLGSQANGAVVDLEFAVAGRQAHISLGRRVASVGYHAVNRREWRAGRLSRIGADPGADPHGAFRAGEPDFSLCRDAARRLNAAVHLRRLQAVGSAVELDRRTVRWVFARQFQIMTAHGPKPV